MTKEQWVQMIEEVEAVVNNYELTVMDSLAERDEESGDLTCESLVLSPMSFEAQHVRERYLKGGL